TSSTTGSGGTTSTSSTTGSGGTTSTSSRTGSGGATSTSSGTGGACSDACTAGATQCAGTQVQTCAQQANGCLGWGAATDCPMNYSCSGNHCVMTPCTPGALQCSGNVLQVCSAGQTWQTQQVCAKVCNAASPACAVGGSPWIAGGHAHTCARLSD